MPETNELTEEDDFTEEDVVCVSRVSATLGCVGLAFLVFILWFMFHYEPSDPKGISPMDKWLMEAGLYLALVAALLCCTVGCASFSWLSVIAARLSEEVPPVIVPSNNRMVGMSHGPLNAAINRAAAVDERGLAVSPSRASG